MRTAALWATIGLLTALALGRAIAVEPESNAPVVPVSWNRTSPGADAAPVYPNAPDAYHPPKPDSSDPEPTLPPLVELPSDGGTKPPQPDEMASPKPEPIIQVGTSCPPGLFEFLKPRVLPLVPPSYGPCPPAMPIPVRPNALGSRLRPGRSAPPALCPPGGPGSVNPVPGMPGVDPMTPPTPGMPPAAQPTPPRNELTEMFSQFQRSGPQQNALNRLTEGGGAPLRMWNQSIFGDFSGVFATQTVTVFEPNPVTTTRVIGERVTLEHGVVVVTPITVQVPGAPIVKTQTVRVGLTGSYSGVQIVDNDSPRPTDRVYFGYNYYDQVGAPLNNGTGENLNRETIGFEKTLLNENASVGMRLPFTQLSGPDFQTRQVGDLSILCKYALYNNRKTGDLVSVGMVLTTPTGGVGFAGSQVLAQHDLPHSWLFQPWAGFVKLYDRVYFQGISNIIVPSDNRDVTVIGNSLVAGYWLYRNADSRTLNGIIPVAEVHVRTPLNHRDVTGQIYLPDMVNLTGGIHFRTPRAVVSGAVSVPTVGPRPWGIEAIGTLNLLF